MRPVAITIAVILAALFAAALLGQGGRNVQELLILAGAALLAFFVIRALWRVWRRMPPAFMRMGLLGAFGVCGVGWLAVALISRLMLTDSSNYIWILLGPFVMLLGLAVIAAGLVGAGVGTAVIASIGAHAERRALVATGAVVSIALNLCLIVQLVRTVVQP